MSARLWLGRGSLAAIALAAHLFVSTAWAGQDVHGTTDAFAGDGVAIAWGVLRGASEATTTVVMRVAVQPGRFARVGADGIDPFTQSRKAIAPLRAPSDVTDVRTPRTHFADFPRTELAFYDALSAPSPVLTIYYLGVPDTTPEFATDAGLDAYLTGRIAKLRAGEGTK